MSNISSAFLIYCLFVSLVSSTVRPNSPSSHQIWVSRGPIDNAMSAGSCAKWRDEELGSPRCEAVLYFLASILGVSVPIVPQRSSFCRPPCFVRQLGPFVTADSRVHLFVSLSGALSTYSRLGYTTGAFSSARKLPAFPP